MRWVMPTARKMFCAEPLAVACVSTIIILYLLWSAMLNYCIFVPFFTLVGCILSERRLNDFRLSFPAMPVCRSEDAHRSAEKDH